MRTTIEIDDDVLAAAKQLAQLKQQGLGRTISELARRGLMPDKAPVQQMEHGIPVWKHSSGAIPVTNELVRSLLDED